MGFYGQGKRVWIVSDAVCSRTTANYKTALQMCRDMEIGIVPTESVLFGLTKDAAHPAFRDISTLVK